MDDFFINDMNGILHKKINLLKEKLEFLNSINSSDNKLKALKNFICTHVKSAEEVGAECITDVKMLSFYIKDLENTLKFADDILQHVKIKSYYRREEHE